MKNLFITASLGLLFSSAMAQPILTESFDFGAPLTWTQYSADGITWDHSISGGTTTAGAMHAFTTLSTQTNAWYQTPTMDLTGMAQPTVQFSTAMAKHIFMDPSTALWYDIGNGWVLLESWGSTWDTQVDNPVMTTILVADPSTWEPLASDWTYASHDATALNNQSSIRFSFEFNGVNAGVIWLDDIKIFDAALATSVDEVAAIEFNVYPNPSDGLVNIAMDELQQPADLSVNDVTGKLVFSTSLSSSSSTIDLSSIPAGIYSITVGNSGVNQSKRIVLK